MNQLYIAIGICVVLVASHTTAYHKGKQRERDKATATALKFREGEQVVITKLDKEEKEREVVYRYKTKIIKEVSDECFDAALPGPAASVLQSLSGDSPKRGADGGLPPARN